MKTLSKLSKKQDNLRVTQLLQAILLLCDKLLCANRCLAMHVIILYEY